MQQIIENVNSREREIRTGKQEAHKEVENYTTENSKKEKWEEKENSGGDIQKGQKEERKGNERKKINGEEENYAIEKERKGEEGKGNGKVERHTRKKERKGKKS